MFDRTVLNSCLNTRELGRSFTYIKACPSTNDVALLLARSHAPSGLIVFTDHQTAGRGRRGSVWVALPETGLTFSLIIRDLSPEQVSLLSITTAGALTFALRSRCPELQVKWPNDIQIAGRKTGGILCESRWEGDQCLYTVVGIGLNVNESRDQFPPVLAPEVTSLSIARKKKLDREELLGSILNQMEEDLAQLSNGNTELLRSRWLQVCSHLNSRVEISTPDSRIIGRFTGIDSLGRACLETAAGERQISSGSLSVLE